MGENATRDILSITFDNKETKNALKADVLTCFGISRDSRSYIKK